MANRTHSPAAPRLSEPDLPTTLEDHALGGRASVVGARLRADGTAVETPHATIEESVFAEHSLDRWDLTGARLVDLCLEDVSVTTLSARDSTWRTVSWHGGRVATLDLSRGTLQNVTLRGLRIDYLNAALAELSDVLFEECSFGTIDLPEVRAERVAFQNCRADELDTRATRSVDVDLRGLEVFRITDLRALSGVTISPGQAELYAAALAATLGIVVQE